MENVVYVTYETVGDTVEADDINDVQHTITDTQKALNAEITRATNAEKTLTTNLNNEISRASNKENAITTNLNNEIARAKKAESDEATRAKNAESKLTTDLTNEVTRAKSEELKANEELLEFRPRVDSKFIVMPPVRVVQNPPKKSKGK